MNNPHFNRDAVTIERESSRDWPSCSTTKTIKVGDLVLLPGDPPLTGARPWRVLDLYDGKARIEFVGEAWTRFKTVPAGDLRIDPSKRSTTPRA